MSTFRSQFFLAIANLGLMLTTPAFGQSQATIPGNTLQSVPSGIGANPNAMNQAWQTPLMAAASKSDEKAVKDFIARKANVNAASEFGMTALMYAQGLPVVRLLLRAGASVNEKDVTGKTALYYAVQQADPDVVRALIKAGANVNAQDDKGMSALQLAKRHCTLRTFQIRVFVMPTTAEFKG